jgi:hypothetical protein
MSPRYLGAQCGCTSFGPPPRRLSCWQGYDRQRHLRGRDRHQESLGKITLTGNIIDILRSNEVPILGVNELHAARLEHLPLHHRDPFDRMLIAQAQIEGLTLVTADRHFSAYDVTLI